MKKISLMIAALVISAASFAQDTKKAQEPVKAAPATKVESAERVAAPGSPQKPAVAKPAPASATGERTAAPAPKKKFVRKNGPTAKAVPGVDGKAK